MSEIKATGRTAEQAKADLRGILGKVRGLLDTAESYRESNPEAAANYQAKAEELMRKYRIAEEHLIAADPVSVEPIRQGIDLADYSSSEFSSHYLGLFQAAAAHAGIRSKYGWVAKKGQDGYSLLADSIGYEGDIRLAELLFTQARLVFQEKIEPKVDPKLSDKENCYRLRSAGIDRQRIAELVFGERTHHNGIKVAKLYKESCAERGEEAALNGRSVNAKTFREAYASQFVERFGRRLRDARNAADSVGGAIVLHGRKERVDEAFYTAFPEYRPATGLAERKPCEACAKKKDGKKCRIHARKAWTAADEARYQRMNHSASALAGKEAGRTAADQVSIDRVAAAQRLEEDHSRKTIREATGLEIEG